MLDTTRAARWLQVTLLADTTLSAAVGGRVYGGRVPESPDGSQRYPCVLHTYQGSAPDTVGLGATRVLTRPLYLVRVLGQTTDPLDLEAAADRLDTVLQAGAGVSGSSPTADLRVAMASRETVFDQLEVADGVEYRHVGGLYRLVLTAL